MMTMRMLLMKMNLKCMSSFSQTSNSNRIIWLKTLPQELVICISKMKKVKKKKRK
jgi:hypothetical protein